MPLTAAYTIKALASQTGLSVHTIRAWERRYGALSPKRSETNRRLYDDGDRVRLELLGRLVASGHSIGQVAKLPTSDLSSLARGVRPAGSAVAASDLLGSCMRAVLRLDEAGLERSMARAGADLGLSGLLEHIVVPLLTWLDHGWSSGELGIAHEHLATAVLRTRLESSRLGLPADDGALRMLVTTPRGQLHEIGALIVALAGALHGWSVVYLGPNMPAREIGRAAYDIHASAVALSIVYPLDDGELSTELQELRRGLGNIELFVGGRGATAYREALDVVQAHTIKNLAEFRVELDRISQAS